ncbi:MAG TPA: O-antigen ligase family protein [Bryobacteraceae bacterium]|nr:O-antigen ligase family protein [Bryobacteraceae bacterium]
MKQPAGGLALLLAYAVLTLWVPARWAWGLFQFAVFAAAAVWAMLQLRRAGTIALSGWLVPLGAATVWGLLQLASNHTVYRWETWNAAFNWATYLTLFLLALQCFARWEARHAFLRWTLYFGFGLALLSMVQMFTSGGKIFWLFPSGYRDFVMGPFVYHNEYAAFMEMILPIALYSALRDRRRAVAYGLMAAAIFASVVASASRAGTLILTMEAAAVVLLAWRRGAIPAGVALRGFAVLILACVSFSAVVGWRPLWRRLVDPESYGGRREFLLSSLAMVRDRPWMGFGLGNWPHVYPQYALFDDGLYVTQAHNDWAQWAVEGGVPFLLILAVLAGMTLPFAVRFLWAIGIPAIWLHCTVEYIFHQRPGLGACVLVLLALLAMEARKRGQAVTTLSPERVGAAH